MGLQADNEGLDQTARICRLLLTLVDQIYDKYPFLMQIYSCDVTPYFPKAAIV